MIKAGDALLSLGQVASVHKSGVRALQGSPEENLALHPHSVSEAQRSFCRRQGFLTMGKIYL